MNPTEPLHRIPLHADSTPIPWETIAPVRLEHYLWLDNGYAPEVKAALCWTPERLHVRFTVRETNPVVRYRKINEPVYKDSCVEFFVQPCPGADPRYLNFELNAAGTLLLKLGANREDRLFLEDYEPGLFRILPSDQTRSPRDFWTLELSIPWEWLQGLFPEFHPERGRTFRGNLYKCGDETPLPHYGCWSRVTSGTPDFHRSCDFGLFILD